MGLSFICFDVAQTLGVFIMKMGWTGGNEIFSVDRFTDNLFFLSLLIVNGVLTFSTSCSWQSLNDVCGFA